jgi:hypothetical protein
LLRRFRETRFTTARIFISWFRWLVVDWFNRFAE